MNDQTETIPAVIGIVESMPPGSTMDSVHRDAVRRALALFGYGSVEEAVAHHQRMEEAAAQYGAGEKMPWQLQSTGDRITRAVVDWQHLMIAMNIVANQEKVDKLVAKGHAIEGARESLARKWVNSDDPDNLIGLAKARLHHECCRECFHKEAKDVGDHGGGEAKVSDMVNALIDKLIADGAPSLEVQMGPGGTKITKHNVTEEDNPFRRG